MDGLEEAEGRRFRVEAPHYPRLARPPEPGQSPAVTYASYPGVGQNYERDEAIEVLKIFTRTWSARGWPAAFEPTMVSDDPGCGTYIRMTLRDVEAILDAAMFRDGCARSG